MLKHQIKKIYIERLVFILTKTISKKKEVAIRHGICFVDRGCRLLNSERAAEN